MGGALILFSLTLATLLLADLTNFYVWLALGVTIGPVMITGATYVIFTYVSGHAKIAEYLQVRYVPGAGEVAVFCGALAAAGLGFLWFNAFPAKMIMGDVGSRSRGAALGMSE